MEWVETTGRTVAEALESALDELGVDEHDAEVVIVAEARSGILGIGRTSARVRARVRPTAPRPKRPQRGRHRDQQRGGRQKESTAVESAATTRADAAPKPASPGSGSPRRRRGGQGKVAEKPAQVSGREGEEPMSVEQQAEAAAAFVRGVVERFGYEGTTTSVRVADEHIFVDVEGENLGLLIGQRGRTLDALQELSRTVIQRRGDEPSARVIVDVAGFRAKRAAALEVFVRRLAEDVLATGEPQELEPMPAPDRKIVHDTVNSIDGVESTSEGMEPERYVVLRPSGASQSSEEALA